MRFHSCSSRAKGASTAVATLATGSTGPVCPDERGRGRVRRPKRHTQLPLVVHKPADEGGAVSYLVEIRPVYAAQQHHGHRQYLRARGAAALLGGRVGPQYPVLPGSPGDGPSGAAQASVERAVRPECEPVLDASPRGAASRGGGTSRLADGGGSRGRLHGSHQDLSGASGETQGA